MTILFSEGASDIFTLLPIQVKKKAARSIDLLKTHPHIYPVRSRGIMRGYHYFVSHGFLFYYSITSTEVRIAAILPGRMRLA